MLVETKATGDGKALRISDDRAVDHEPHMTILDRGEQTAGERISPIDRIQAALRHHYVIEGQSALLSIGHVHDQLAGGDRARGKHYGRKPVGVLLEPIEAAPQAILSVVDTSVA